MQEDNQIEPHLDGAMANSLGKKVFKFILYAVAASVGLSVVGVVLGSNYLAGMVLAAPIGLVALFFRRKLNAFSTTAVVVAMALTVWLGVSTQDQTEKARSLGFISSDEMEEAADAGFSDKASWAKHLAAKAGNEAQKEAATVPAVPVQAPVQTPTSIEDSVDTLGLAARDVAAWRCVAIHALVINFGPQYGEIAEQQLAQLYKQTKELDLLISVQDEAGVKYMNDYGSGLLKDMNGKFRKPSGDVNVAAVTPYFREKLRAANQCHSKLVVTASSPSNVPVASGSGSKPYWAKVCKAWASANRECISGNNYSGCISSYMASALGPDERNAGIGAPNACNEDGSAKY